MSATILTRISLLGPVSVPRLRKTIVIRHSSDHRIVALIELLSLGNKATSFEIDRFLSKACSALRQGIHLLMVDLYPPGRFDPDGIHGALWKALGQEPFAASHDKPLQAAAYQVDEGISAYVEPLAIGSRIPDMPAFLTPDRYVSVPLEMTYLSGFEALPAYWREKLR